MTCQKAVHRVLSPATPTFSSSVILKLGLPARSLLRKGITQASWRQRNWFRTTGKMFGFCFIIYLVPRIRFWEDLKIRSKCSCPRGSFFANGRSNASGATVAPSMDRWREIPISNSGALLYSWPMRTTHGLPVSTSFINSCPRTFLFSKKSFCAISARRMASKATFLLKPNLSAAF